MAPLPLGIKLRVDHTIVDGSTWREQLPGLIDRSNVRTRLEGLPDQLNPEMIDLQKAEAFLAALVKLPNAALQSIAGKTLYLNYPGLMIGASAPTRPTSFAEPFGIEVADVQGDLVLARLTIQLDGDLAHRRAAEARGRITIADSEVKALEVQLLAMSGTPEKEREALVSLSKARARRYAIACVWRDHADAWVRRVPSDRDAKADLEAAAAAASAYIELVGGGMP